MSDILTLLPIQFKPADDTLNLFWLNMHEQAWLFLFKTEKEGKKNQKKKP